MNVCEDIREREGGESVGERGEKGEERGSNTEEGVMTEITQRV